MKIIVQKFGGSSVKNTEMLFRVGEIIKSYREEGYQLVVVVSAQGRNTDNLIEKALTIHEEPPARELDMLMATGELMSAALLAIALDKLGIPAIAMSGIQAGIKTDGNYKQGRILSVDTENILSHLKENRVVVVSGFQGEGLDREYVTLGRGGSDTSATAIAAALKADRCQIYTDVQGVFTADPRKLKDARQLPKISYHNMLLMARMGAKILHSPSVEFARNARLPLEILSTLDPSVDTMITSDVSPTAVCGITSQKGFYRTEIPLRIPANPLELEEFITPPSCFEVIRKDESNWFTLYTEGKPNAEIIKRLAELSHMPHRISTIPVNRIAVVGDELPYNNHLIWDILEVKNSVYASRIFTTRGCCWMFTEPELCDLLVASLHKTLIESPTIHQDDTAEEES